MAKDYISWFGEEYIKSTNIQNINIPKKLKSAFLKHGNNMQFHENGSTNSAVRLTSLIDMKSKYQIHPNGYICARFDFILDTPQTGRLRSNYGYIYIRPDEIEPEFICYSPTYESRDGEYRNRFIRYDKFKQGLESNSAKLEQFELAIINAMEEYDLQFNVKLLNELEISQKDSVISFIENSRLSLTMLSCVLILDMFQIVNNGVYNANTNQSYQKLLSFFNEKYIHLRNASIEFMYSLSSKDQNNEKLIEFGDLMRCSQIGQKLVPLYLNEVIYLNNINLPAWKEHLVTSIVGDLFINYISPSFSVYNGWSYIVGTDDNFYDNSAIHNKFKRGKKVELTLKSIRDARSSIGLDDRNFAEEDLSAQLYSAIEYTNSHLYVSNVSLIHTMEKVGEPISELGPRIRYSTYLKYPLQQAFANGVKMLFEMLYSAHCLHTKIGVVHGDMHSGNVTYFSYANNYRKMKTAVVSEIKKQDYMQDSSNRFLQFECIYKETPIVIYTVNDKSFAFNESNVTPCIIDYSRCFYGEKMKSRINETEHFTANFYTDQVSRIMKVLHRYAKGFTEENQVALKAILNTNLELCFPVLSCIDFLAMLRMYISILKMETATNLAYADYYAARAKDRYQKDIPNPLEIEHYYVNIDPKTLPLCIAIETRVNDLFISGLQSLVLYVEGDVRPTNRYVGEIIFDEFFKDNIIDESNVESKFANTILLDVYSHENTLKYSLTKYDLYPPFMKINVIEKHLGELKLGDVVYDPKGFLSSFGEKRRIKSFSDKEKYKKELLDGKHISVATSWLD